MKLIPSFVSASAGILVAVAALAAAPAAWAGNLVFSVGFQVPGGHVGHAPAHVQRAPVVVAPQHTYPQHGHGYGHVQAAPVHVYPAPVIVQAPPVVHYAPPPPHWRARHHHHGHVRPYRNEDWYRY
ncbi:MAG: hypothetical protein IPG42_15830 [Betaproteobacteria bacterium]|jgi:hypothetical protein|nr:hypothetical protein [Betaproteobacteria bacterium]MBP6645124.1 hypothetical protein [Burkholderiaceae bacterium]